MKNVELENKIKELETKIALLELQLQSTKWYPVYVERYVPYYPQYPQYPYYVCSSGQNMQSTTTLSQ